MMTNYDIKKGDIYYAVLDPVIGSEQNGTRPVVVVQNNFGNKYSPTIIVAPITTVLKKQDMSTHILIEKNSFMKSNSIILIEQIRVIDKTRLEHYLGKLTDMQIKQIDRSLINAFAIDIKNIEREEKYDKNF